MTEFCRDSTGEESHTDRSDHDQCCQKQHLDAGPQHILHLDLVQIFAHLLILVFQILDGSLCHNGFRHILQLFGHLFHHLASRFIRKLRDRIHHIHPVRKLHLLCQCLLRLRLLQAGHCQHCPSEDRIQRISFFIFQFFVGINTVFQYIIFFDFFLLITVHE